LLSSSSLSSQNRCQNDESLCRGLLIIHISAWSSIPDLPFLKRDCLLVEHIHVCQNVFNNGETDRRFFIVTTDKRPVHPLGLCFRLVCAGNMIHRAVVKRLAKFLCGLPRPSALKLNSTNILTTTSFRLHVY